MYKSQITQDSWRGRFKWLRQNAMCFGSIIENQTWKFWHTPLPPPVFQGKDPKIFRISGSEEDAMLGEEIPQAELTNSLQPLESLQCQAPKSNMTPPKTNMTMENHHV